MLIEATTRTTTGPVHILNGNDDLNVAAGVTIESVDYDAVTTWSGQHIFTVSGTIIGYDEAINTIGCTDAQTVTIFATGALVSGGDGAIEDADGVILDGAWSVLKNYGSITSYGSCGSLFVRENATTTVTNTGTMEGRVAGIWHKFGGGTLEIINTGTIESPNFAVLGGLGADRITNRGTMIGDIELGEGNDQYDGRNGTVSGTVTGGAGGDRMYAGTGIEDFDGGSGSDTLIFWGAGAVNLALDGSITATGRAAGDTYANFENIYGSGAGDHLVGDSGANQLSGYDGADLLAGGGGNDTLQGGLGIDTLTGGLGSDRFVFASLAELGDAITDFGSGGTDSIRIDGSEFGGNMKHGTIYATMFQERADNVAQDWSDRFIFRTTDATLWFDADGKGVAAPVLVADLQDGATLAYSQILIF